jgi:AbrB family looped-hinge helix DNA binding protein
VPQAIAAHLLLLRSRCNTGYPLEVVVVLNTKGQVTIPANLRAKYGLHPGDEVEVIEVGGALQIVRAEGAESRGQRLARRLRNTATGQEVAGMSTDEIMALLRGE